MTGSSCLLNKFGIKYSISLPHSLSRNSLKHLPSNVKVEENNAMHMTTHWTYELYPTNFKFRKTLPVIEKPDHFSTVFLNNLQTYYIPSVLWIIDSEQATKIVFREYAWISIPKTLPTLFKQIEEVFIFRRFEFSPFSVSLLSNPFQTSPSSPLTDQIIRYQHPFPTTGCKGLENSFKMGHLVLHNNKANCGSAHCFKAAKCFQ